MDLHALAPTHACAHAGTRTQVDVLGRMMWHLTKKNGGDNMMDIIMSLVPHTFVNS